MSRIITDRPPFYTVIVFKFVYSQEKNIWRHIPIKHSAYLLIMTINCRYRSGTVNSKSFVGKVLLRIKWKFKLINAL